MVITAELLCLEVHYTSIGCGKLCEIVWDVYRLLQSVDLHPNASVPALVVFLLNPAPGSGCLLTDILKGDKLHTETFFTCLPLCSGIVLCDHTPMSGTGKASATS